MTKSPKVTYAQSSDIKSRTYMQYRKDMKRKAIAELEMLPFLQRVLSERFDDKDLRVEKHGGDTETWFGRTGGSVTQAPDFKCILSDGEQRLYEFQYAEEIDKLKFFGFKVSKVGKKPANQDRIPHSDRQFFYVVKPLGKYGFIKCDWIMNNSRFGGVPAWGNRSAYRVPREAFLRDCNRDGGDALAQTIREIDNKNLLLDFQHAYMDVESQALSRELQNVIDEERMVKIIPKTLDGFFRVCHMLDRLDKAPDSPGVWLVYLASFFSMDLNTQDFARLMYCLDYLNFKSASLQDNEKNALSRTLDTEKTYLDTRYASSEFPFEDLNSPPIKTVHRLLFASNLLEDLIQDCVAHWRMGLTPIAKIFETVSDVGWIAQMIRSAS